MKNNRLVEVVQKYYQFRGLTEPDTNQALLFLVSEIGELSDAFVSNQAQWVRNNPEKDRSVQDEIGDVLMMLTVFAASMGVDPIEALMEKMRKKGFDNLQ